MAWMLLILWALVVGPTNAANLDTVATTPEDQWYNPALHSDEVRQFLAAWEGEQCWHALDVFGASKAVMRCFQQAGFQATALDVAIGGHEHDILTKAGWYTFLGALMQLFLG